ncbi:CAAX geranylgeranyltransferase alpha subunit [Coemansia sp. Benny D115]|nr:CAAX geranylgeranyltransferase alpha subunit [Coemansia sp. Benny D115]
MSRTSSDSDRNSVVSEEPAVPLREQELWANVVPLGQDEEPALVCPIAYTDEYREMMGYLRAVMAVGEVSQRAFDLTSDVIWENPGHYTVWVYRKQLLAELHLDAAAELEWLADISGRFPKNYQSWHHRESVVAMALDPEALAGLTQDQRICNPVLRGELRFLSQAIDADSKNFHAWSYRQWLVRHYGVWDQECVFAATMIDQDVRNNSAWNQRYFALVQGQPPKSASLSADTALAEVAFAVAMIARAPNNESPWAYIVGLLLRHAPDLLHAELLPRIQALAADPDSDCSADVRASPFYWSTLVDIYEHHAQAQPEGSERRAELLLLARSACDLLTSEHDPVRMKYWEFRRASLA